MTFSLDFLFRIIIAAAVFLIGTGLFYFNFLTFPKYAKEDDVVIGELCNFKTAHWTHTCRLLGFLFFAGNPFVEEAYYSLPMYFLYNLQYLEEMAIELILYFTMPFIIALVFRTFVFWKMFGFYVVRYMWLRYIKSIGIGMIIGQGFELLGRLIGLTGPKNGSILYFVFFALIICQIIYIVWNCFHFVTSFFFSFFSGEALRNLAENLRMERIMWQNRPSEAESGSGGGSSDSQKGFKFPDSLEINGETYRLEHSDNEKAQYYCPRTGDRQQVRREKLDY